MSATIFGAAFPPPHIFRRFTGHQFNPRCYPGSAVHSAPGHFRLLCLPSIVCRSWQISPFSFFLFSAGRLAESYHHRRAERHWHLPCCPHTTRRILLDWRDCSGRQKVIPTKLSPLSSPELCN